MNRLVLTMLNGRQVDVYAPRNAVWTVRESADGNSRVLSSSDGEEYFVKETREQIAAQVQP